MAQLDFGLPWPPGKEPVAVLAAYAAVDPAGEWSEDWAEVWTETGAGQPLPPRHALAERRKETDQRVLANLLRMNLARAGAAQE